MTVLSLALGAVPACQVPGDADDVAQVLDDWHRAASAAQMRRYFDHFADDAVFLGTDPEERWSVDEFRRYAEPHFRRGQGWTYVPYDRHVALGDGYAWFDERLHSEKYGELRGTGVLRSEAGTWRIVQYSMTFPVPNERTPEVVETIRRVEP